LTHPIVMAYVAKMDANLKEDWEERAAILEFDACVGRDLAEALALLLIIQQYSEEASRFLL
jgi:hypothetical protein